MAQHSFVFKRYGLGNYLVIMGTNCREGGWFRPDISILTCVMMEFASLETHFWIQNQQQANERDIKYMDGTTSAFCIVYNIHSTYITFSCF